MSEPAASADMEYRLLGASGIRVSAVALGCWPIAGMTSGGVTDRDSLATIEACFELGINFLDTAYAYGMQGESERLIGQALAGRRDQMVIATKGGIHWQPGRKQMLDARPETLVRECEASLSRLRTDHVDLLYLHAPDPNTPLADSAAALAELRRQGKTRAVGVSNVSFDQLRQFASVCPLTAFQPAFNMLDRGIERELLPWCREHHVAVVVYWPLVKGLLAGRLARDHVFPTTDSRHKYPMFQGEEYQRNLDLVDQLRPIAAECGHSVAQLVINWTIHQPGITSALCGAKRPDQICENAAGAGWQLTADQAARIDSALAARGAAASRMPV
jgi:aryl-alcohol dehydrogenase-like predicted oxidoreductase